MEQNREPKNKPTHQDQLIFDKRSKTIQWRKDSLFNEWYQENWTAICKSVKLEHSFTPHINKMKRQPTGWEKIFAYEAANKGFISKI